MDSNCVTEPAVLPDNQIFPSSSPKIQVLSNVEISSPTSSNAHISDKSVVAKVKSLNEDGTKVIPMNGKEMSLKDVVQRILYAIWLIVITGSKISAQHLFKEEKLLIL